MVRILHIVTYMGRGGLETLIMNCYRHIDREQIQFDFLVHREFRADYDDEIETLGGKIYRLQRLNPFHPGYYKALDTFFRDHPEYKIVHSHLDCMSSIPLSVAKKRGVPVRIAHSHNASQDRDWKYPMKLYFAKRIPDVATQLCACSKKAGSWMFSGAPFTVIHNGIDTNKFQFDPAVREAVREELGLQGKFVLGHVGRFMPQKNHSFLIDIFSEVHKRNPDTMLVLLGSGPLEDDIKNKVSGLGLNESVRFLAPREDVSPLYQAMDAFIFPSLYEGFGIVAIEAQAAGLPCFLSDTIPEDCALADDLITRLSLSDSPDLWAEQILSQSGALRRDHSDAVSRRGYDISQTAQYLTDFYFTQEQRCND